MQAFGYIYMLVSYWQFLGGGMAGLPIAVPPGETPLELYAAAPDECIFYMISSGSEEIDPNSACPSEQFLAEPEIQEFVAELERYAHAGIEELSEEEEYELIVFLFDAFRCVQTKPWLVCIEEGSLYDEGSLDITALKASAAIRLDDKMDDWKQTLLQSNIFPEDMPPLAEKTVDGAIVYAIRFEEDAIPLDLVFTNGWLLVGSGENAIEELIARFKNPAEEPPAWLEETVAAIEIPQRSTLFYINVDDINNMFIEAFAEESNAGFEPSMKELIELKELFGLFNLSAVYSASGFDERGYAEETILQFDGPPTGLLGALAGGSLSSDNLSCVPSDANIAAAYNLDMDELLDAILKFADAQYFSELRSSPGGFPIGFGPAPSFEPEETPLQEIDQTSTSLALPPGSTPNFSENGDWMNEDGDGPFIINPDSLLPQQSPTIEPSKVVETYCQMLKMEYGVDPIEDLLPLLGDSIVYYNSPNEGGYFFTGSTLVFELLDAEKFLKLQETLLGGLRESYPEFMEKAVRIVEFEGGKMYVFQSTSDFMPFFPTWAVSEGRLIVSISPENIRAALSRDSDFESLADSELLTTLLDGEYSPCGFTYQDRREILKMFYPLLVLFLKGTIPASMSEYDFDFNPTMFPSLAVLTRHSQPAICFARTDGDRIVLRTSRTFPGGMKDPLALIACIACFSRAYEVEDDSENLEILEDFPLTIDSRGGRVILGSLRRLLLSSVDAHDQNVEN